VATAREQIAKAGIALSLEWSLTQVGLALPEPPPQAIRGLLADARATVDRPMHDVNAAVSGLQTSSQIDTFTRRRDRSARRQRTRDAPPRRGDAWRRWQDTGGGERRR
jgi:hypothetical protein